MASKPDRRIIAIAKKLLEQLAQDSIKIEKAYLFGSHVAGTANEYSDIDIALVSNDFCGVRFLDQRKLDQYVLSLDSRLEIHPYRADEFNEESRWFVKEILDTGIRIL